MRIGSVLGSYDFFAKTIPGVLFFIGFVSLWSSVPELPEGQFDFAFVSVALIVTGISGFVIGQALHAFAVAAESGGYRIAAYVYLNFKYLRTNYWQNRTGLSGGISDRSPDEIYPRLQKISLFISFILSIPARVYCWIVGRLKEALLPHRVWFMQRLQREFSEGGEPDAIYEWFKWQSRDHLLSVEGDVSDEHEKIYRFVMSYLQMTGAGRARKFQATSSFCRSTWITLIVFGLVYGIIILVDPEVILGYKPIVLPLLEDHGPIVLTSLFLGTILFMYSAGQYKKHFTEYIAVDFYNAIERGAGGTTTTIESSQLEVKINNESNLK